MTFWIIIGGALGWLASVLLDEEAPDSILSNAIAGAAGALAGSVIAGQGTPAMADSSTLAFVATLAGSIALIAAVNLARRRLRA